MHRYRLRQLATAMTERSQITAIAVVCFLLVRCNGSTRSSKIPCCDTAGGSLRRNLPPVEQWPHRPVFLIPASIARNDTDSSSDQDPVVPLPLGTPFPLETPLFKGRMLVRLRHCPDQHSSKHVSYFNRRKKVLMQIVLQGRFKKTVRMSEVYMGSRFDRPLRLVPPPLVKRALYALLNRVSPGVNVDLTSERPKVFALYAGSVESMSIDVLGQEPDITVGYLPENVGNVLGEKLNTEKRRRMQLSKPQEASLYEFDMNHVYTFHTVDEVMDYAQFRMRVPMLGNFDLRKVFGRQPVNLSAETVHGETLFSLKLFHESLYNDDDC